MNNTLSTRSLWLRRSYQFLFSLNLAWTVVWIERVRTKVLGGRVLAELVSALARGASQLVTPIGGKTILEQLIGSLALAVFIFVLLRLLSRTALAETLLRFLPGATAILGFPLASTLVPYAFISGSSRIATYHLGLILEVIVVLICGAVYYVRKFKLSIWFMIVVLFLHFTAWTWITSSYVNIPAFIAALRSSEYYHPWTRTLASLSLALLFNFGFAVLGFVCGLLWVWHVTPVETVSN